MVLAAEASRQEGSSPNVAIGAALSILGPRRVNEARSGMQTPRDIFVGSGVMDPFLPFDIKGLGKAIPTDILDAYLTKRPEDISQHILKALHASGNPPSLFVSWRRLRKKEGSFCRAAYCLPAFALPRVGDPS